VEADSPGRNNRDGTFTDVTGKVGVATGGYGQGIAVGDYDGDGKFDEIAALAGVGFTR
jgi:enediyne biosynthesis protein E4